MSGGRLKTRPKLGIALGSGSARGWAHIGVIRALAAAGIEFDVVCGCSIGALVGAAYVNGDIDKLEKWVAALHWKDVLGLLDVSFNGGLIKGDKLIDFIRRHFVDHEFGALEKPFACVATDLESGREIWLREGSVADAVRASIAMPGLFTPVLRDGRLLVDGALVNPVPVSLCRALGADLVIAVDLGSERPGRGHRQSDKEAAASWKQKVLNGFGLTSINSAQAAESETLPSLIEVLAGSLQIMQVRIARSRLAGEPADVMLAPRLGQLTTMDYHRGGEAIAEGHAEVERMLPVIRHALED
ncbi:MAG: patatin-like phospholipase RssA [Rhodocyclaceae bacterium]|nr:MAG: patatin-like phospholipase RssA [Rhodocyclaceae bacterium]